MSWLDAILAAVISLSVIPPNAETTTMTFSLQSQIIFFTVLRLPAFPTDVPPNFNTFITRLINLFHQGYKSYVLRILARNVWENMHTDALPLYKMNKYICFLSVGKYNEKSINCVNVL